MKLFASTLISWSEPWFFALRIRDAAGWRPRIILAVVLSAVFAATIYYLSPLEPSILRALWLGCVIGVILVALLDMKNIQRDVTAYQDSINVSSSAGRFWFKGFKRDQIESIELTRPEEWNRPYGGMVIQTLSETFTVGVPRKVSLDILANVLARQNHSVQLSDWEPSDRDSRVQTRDDAELNPNRARGVISIDPIEPPEGRLMTPLHIAIQLVVALGPLVAAIVGAIFAVNSLYRQWDDLSVLRIVLIGGGAVAAVVLTFLYLLMIGQFIAASYGISVARNRMRMRPNSQFSGLEDDLVTVELFDREMWTAVASQAADYGFLQIDRRQRRLTFEGNHNRWSLPLGALTACRIEESTVGREGTTNGEKRYYVVLAADCIDDGEEAEWEAGLIYTRTDIGNDNAERRYNRAQLLFRQIAEAL